MSDLATAAEGASILAAPTENNEQSLFSAKNVAIALIATVVVVGLGFAIYKVIAHYRGKKIEQAKLTTKTEKTVEVVATASAPVAAAAAPVVAPVAAPAPVAAAPVAAPVA